MYDYMREQRAADFKKYLASVSVWKYPIKDVEVNQFRVPEGSRYLWFTTDSNGRPAVAFGVPDTLASCETRYFVRLDEYSSHKKDDKMTYRDSLEVGYKRYTFYEVKAGHPLVYRYIR